MPTEKTIDQILAEVNAEAEAKIAMAAQAANEADVLKQAQEEVQ
jgi:hypothetical protein